MGGNVKKSKCNYLYVKCLLIQYDLIINTRVNDI